MDRILLASNLSRRGFGPDEVARLTRQGDLVRIRRGAYLRSKADSDEANDDDPQSELLLRHRRLILGTVPQLHPRAVLSHGSAATVHGLPVFPAAVDRVHVTRDRSGGGVRRSVVHVHGAPLSKAEIVELDGTTVTSLARTVADLARTLPFDQAVAIGDQALRVGLDRAELVVVLDRCARWAGAPQARRAASFIDPRAESVGESFSRVRCHDLDLPSPVPQFPVFDERKRLVGRCDFGWPELRTVGEFDGRIKYGRLLRSGQSIEEVVYHEKLREDALRDLGWQVVRWIWAELFRPWVIADRLERAFARGRQ